MRRFRTTLTLSLCIAALGSTALAQTTFSRRTYNHSGLLRGDFNRDGKPDLLGTGTGTFRVLLNNGDGTFRGPITTSQPGGHRALALADFNRDGRSDLVGCLSADPDGTPPMEFAVWTGTGTATFSPPRRFALGAGDCRSVSVEDFNQDGNHDAAVVWALGGEIPNNGVTVYFGDGAGGVSHSMTTSDIAATSDNNLRCMFSNGAAGNYDRSGAPDLMISAFCSNDTFDQSVLLFGRGTGTGQFGFSKTNDVNRSLSLSTDALNQDSRPDMFVFESLSGPHAASISGISAYINTAPTGTPIWQSKEIYVHGGDGDCVGSVEGGEPGDLNGDGIKDAAFSERFRPGDCIDFTDTYNLGVMLGRADGSYSTPQKFSLPNHPGGISSGDFDRDGRIDLALARGSVTEIFLNRTSTAPTCPANATLRTVKICAPASISGNTLHLRANTTSGGPITGMKVYLDNTEVFFTPNDIINKKLTVPAGSHRITVRAWDGQGSFSSSLTVTAGGGSSCATPSTNRSINVCSPVNESTVSNPVRVTAAVRTSNTYHAAKIYIDGVARHSTGSKQVEASFTLSAGRHRISVQAYDTQGAFTKTVFVNVR